MKHILRTVVALGLAAAPSLSQPAFAQTPPSPPSTAATPAPKAPAPAPAKKVTLTVGTDVTSAYLFRGILQDDQGSIVQPYVDVGVAAGHGVTVNFGNWESWHSIRTSHFYESDYYGSVTGTAGKWKPGVLFTSYTSPKDAFKTVNELAFVLSYDDSAMKMPWSPKIVLAQELTDGQADGGLHKGTYLELGARPTKKLVDGKTAFAIAIPIKLGLGLKDYYETSATTSNKFGYLDVGIIGSVPVTLSKGTIEFHGGVDFFKIGDGYPNGTRFTMGDHGKAVVSAGVSYVY
jgi:hypothetical protein